LRLLVEPDRRQPVSQAPVLHLERVHRFDAAELAIDLPPGRSEGLRAPDADDLAAIESILV
jgi:hypothetical protein